MADLKPPTLAAQALGWRDPVTGEALESLAAERSLLDGSAGWEFDV